MKNRGIHPIRTAIFALSIYGSLWLGLSCKPATGLFPTDTFVEADTVYYCDLIIFMSKGESPREIIVCEFGREKRGEDYNGEFWGCVSLGGNWDNLEKTGKFHLLSSRPSVPEGPPGVDLQAQGLNLDLKYAARDYRFRVRSKNLSTRYNVANDEKLREYYGIADGELMLDERQVKGIVFYGFTRWVGYQPITAKYRGRYKDFQRFFLFNDDVFLFAMENKADQAELMSKYEFSTIPSEVSAFLKVGSYQKTFDDFKSITTDRSFDFALFRVPFGWELQFEKSISVVLSGEGYYLDNKILTGRAMVGVSGALNFKGHDYQLAGICEFIK